MWLPLSQVRAAGRGMMMKGRVMGDSRGTRSQQRWAGAVLVPVMIGRHSAEMLSAAAGLSILVLVLVVAAVALGSAFARSAARRRACLQSLQALLRLAPWTRQ
jgi:hypothetical protein